MILLSFDIEEFDTPNLSYRQALNWQEQVDISTKGTQAILDILAICGVSATFFCTAMFAQAKPELIQRIVAEQHELASHTYDHGKYDRGDAKRSRDILQRIGQTAVDGIRFPRMQGIETSELIAAGYRYDSSLNPCFIPGRYSHTKAPRTPFKDKDLWIVPASVTPMLRIPLFWLSFHHFPMWLYQALVQRTLRHDGHVLLYFHPWEFADLKTLGLPYLISHRTGTRMQQRFGHWICEMQARKHHFGRIGDFVK